MKYSIRETTAFRKGVKRMLKRGVDRTKLSKVVRLLAQGETLPPKYRDHALTGDLVGFRDCHIEPDWLLIYRIEDDVLVLTLTGTGTHADLF